MVSNGSQYYDTYIPLAFSIIPLVISLRNFPFTCSPRFSFILIRFSRYFSISFPLARISSLMGFGKICMTVPIFGREVTNKCSCGPRLASSDNNSGLVSELHSSSASRTIKSFEKSAISALRTFESSERIGEVFFFACSF